MNEVPHASPPFSATLPTVRRLTVPTGHQSSMKWALIAFAGLLVCFMGLIALLLIGVETGFIGLIAGVVLATLPVPIYIALLLWIDRFEPEPVWLLATAFLWGGLVSFICSFILNTLNSVIAASVLGSNNAGMAVGAMFSAPLVEESSKGAFLFVLYFWRRKDFDGVLDGIVYAGMTALGFAMTENMLYYGRQLAPEGKLVATLVIRGVLSPFLHPLFTSMTGIGLGIARESRNMAIKFIAPVAGLALAMLLHCIWNSTATLGGEVGFLLMYFLFMVPVFLLVVGIIVFALLREGRMVRKNLQAEISNGTLSIEDLQRIGTVSGRLGASVRAMMSGGFGGWNARRRFHDAAAQLAFHRNRIESGVIQRDSAAADQEEALLLCICEWKAKLHGTAGKNG